MKTKCDFCGRPFGLVRYRWGRYRFCRKRCERVFREHRDRELGVFQLLKWLRVIPS